MKTRINNSENALIERLIGTDKKLARVMANQEGLASVASALLQLRAATGQTQAQFAKVAGITKTMISEIENAANPGLTLRTLSRIAKAGGSRLVLSFTCEADSRSVGTVSSEVLGDLAAVRRQHFTVLDGGQTLRKEGLAA